eukprot:gene5363-7438_t
MSKRNTLNLDKSIRSDAENTISVPFPKNYFGLPIYSFQLSPTALAYQCRKSLPLRATNDDSNTQNDTNSQDFKNDLDNITRKGHESSTELIANDNYVSQRKVAQALLTMASNIQMAPHFLHKGGFEAVIKLISDSKDSAVLTACAEALIQTSSSVKNTKTIFDKGIMSAVSILIDNLDDWIKHLASIIMANMTNNPELDDLLVMNGILSTIQSMIVHAQKIETILFLLLSLSNVCVAFSGPDAEIAVRLLMQTSKKVDVSKSVIKATFISEAFMSFSRVNIYSSMLCDEGVIPLLLHMMDSHSFDENILSRCTEAIANLSVNRKNRREIASSGIASRLGTIFMNGSSQARASTLLIMGNLLSSGLFHDKVAHNHTISNILDNLLDLNYPKQFLAVTYCICQLSRVHSSCEVMIDCRVIPIVLGYIRKAPPGSTEFLWMLLVNISKHRDFFLALVSEIELLIEEISYVIKCLPNTSHQHEVVSISLNMSMRFELSTYMNQEQVIKFVNAMKLAFSSEFVTFSVQDAALATLINFALYCPSARSPLLGSDLISLFLDVGIQNEQLNIKYISLLNIISNEENCCYRLLELGAQAFIVSLQESFGKSSKSLASDKKNNHNEAKRGSTSNNNNNNNFDTTNSISNNNEGELSVEVGFDLSAATLHNIALKRAILVPGVLTSIMALSKNTKELRVLHCTRALAKMSEHPKSKIALNKEAKKIIPLLTVIMRCGCKEAEKVQHYSAIVICNILSMVIDKGLLKDLIKSGAVVDLVVVTLLRINSITTKEALGKAFFNLLTVPDIRENLVMQQDMLASVMELAKIEYVDLLELCVRTFYNITCQLKSGSGFEDSFSSKLIALNVPTFMLAKLNYSPSQSGALSNQAIKLLLGMSIANMSFNKQLVIDLCRQAPVSKSSNNNKSSSSSEPSLTVANALRRVYVLNIEEAIYCCCVTIFNISMIPDCRVLAGSTTALELLVDVLKRDSCSVLCMKLAIAAMCNFSLMPEFQEQMSAVALSSIVSVIGAPQFHMSVKVDAVQTIYNLVTMYPQSRVALIECEGIIALWKMLKILGGSSSNNPAPTGNNPDNQSASPVNKGQKNLNNNNSNNNTNNNDAGSVLSINDCDVPVDEESALVLIAHIVKDLCGDVQSDIKVEKKIMSGGVMNIILKLAKIEMPLLKLFMSNAIYAMSRGGEIMKVLKWDAIDILFWLTLYDTLGLHDTILRNVSRALRNFSCLAEESRVLLKQERFFPVIKALIKSKNEDVLWQTAGVLYNMMRIEANLKPLLEKGLVQLIFEIASSGFQSVKHICSACLHMIPDNMPNMEDPLVLELVLALLEAHGDKFSEYEWMNLGTLFKHVWTDFTANWTTLTCPVDSIFSPSLLTEPFVKNTIELTSLTQMDQIAIIPPEKILSKNYNNFEEIIINNNDNNNNNNNNNNNVSYKNRRMSRDYDYNVTTPSINALKPPETLMNNNPTISNNSNSRPNSQGKQDNNNDGNDAKSLTSLASTSSHGSSLYDIAKTATKNKKNKKNVLNKFDNNNNNNNNTKGLSMSMSSSLPLIQSGQYSIPSNTVEVLHSSIIKKNNRK